MSISNGLYALLAPQRSRQPAGRRMAAIVIVVMLVFLLATACDGNGGPVAAVSGPTANASVLTTSPATTIPDQYIVTFTSDVKDVPGLANHPVFMAEMGETTRAFDATVGDGIASADKED